MKGIEKMFNIRDKGAEAETNMTMDDYDVTNELAITKCENDTGEIWTMPALHIFKGRLPQNVIDDLCEYVGNENNNDANDRLVANISGTQSHLLTENPLMKDFYNIMMEAACTYVDQCSMKCNYSNGTDTSRTIEVSDVWSVKMKEGDYNPLHIHESNAHNGLSSICYLKVPSIITEEAMEQGKLVVSGEDYRSTSLTSHGWLSFVWGADGRRDDFLCPTNKVVLPEVGDFYIFPKTLHHMVYPFRGPEERWSIQMNFDVWQPNEAMGGMTIEQGEDIVKDEA